MINACVEHVGSLLRPPYLRQPREARAQGQLTDDEFTFVRACTNRQAKVTLPSPSLFANLWDPRRSSAGWPSAPSVDSPPPYREIRFHQTHNGPNWRNS